MVKSSLLWTWCSLLLILDRWGVQDHCRQAARGVICGGKFTVRQQALRDLFLSAHAFSFLLNSTPFSGPCGHERSSSSEWEGRPQNAIHVHPAATNVSVGFLSQLETSLTERPAHLIGPRQHHSSYSLRSMALLCFNSSTFCPLSMRILHFN